MLCFTFKAFSQFTYVPDNNFEQALIDQGYDDILDNYVLTENIDTVSYLLINNKGISDLTGIEGFKALTTLFCYQNQLSTLDLSENLALNSLICYNNQLTSLNVRSNTSLTNLICYNNQLTTLDVSNNKALADLRCYNNQLTALEVNNNTALTNLMCFNNQLNTLDVSQNKVLTYLYCYENRLTSLDVSNNTVLVDLICNSNQLTMLDVTKNTALTSLICSNNDLTMLDVKNGNNTMIYNFSAWGNSNLACITVDNVEWSTENWSSGISSSTSFSEDCSTLGVDEELVDEELLVYPNPTNSNLFVRISQEGMFKLFNSLGQAIKTGNLLNATNSIDLSDIESGVYFLKIETAEEMLTKVVQIN